MRYATTISPLEASGRVAPSEAGHAAVRFGPLELGSLLVGAHTLGRWIFGFSSGELLVVSDRILDFVGLPLFTYGVGCLLASNRPWMQRLLGPLVKAIGGQLAPLALGHIAMKPHRTAGLLLTVALTVSVCLYPTVAGPSFEDRAVRGVRVATGTAWHFTFNAPDLGPAQDAREPLALQLAALGPGIQGITRALRGIRDVRSVTVMAEAILPDFYLPGYGYRGVPLYLLTDVDDFVRQVYSEPELGTSHEYQDIVERLAAGEVAVSRAVADFWTLSRGVAAPVGMTPQLETVSAPVAGVLSFLPGMPMRSVADRRGFLQARTDYLNYLFGNDGYLVASAANAALANVQALVPRVVVLAATEAGRSAAAVEADIRRTLPVAPLEVHRFEDEIRRVGSDMFVYLALANMKVFVAGGFLLALVSILAIALVNYAEDRRTLALLRIRGASPVHIRRLLTALTLSPALLGVVIGAAIALAAGFGLANHLWHLRELQSAIQLLPTRLVVSAATVALALVILVVLGGVAHSFSRWVFRRTVQETLSDG